MARWTAGEHDDDYTESFPAFRERVDAALADVVEAGTAWSCLLRRTDLGDRAELLAGGRPTYARLAPGIVNAAITRVISGRRGLTLVSFNEHQHLAGSCSPTAERSGQELAGWLR